jgi:hypothetical protein
MNYGGAFLFSIIVRRGNDKNSIGNCTGTLRHHTKSTSLIITSHHKKFKCRVSGAKLLRSCNQVYSNAY